MEELKKKIEELEKRIDKLELEMERTIKRPVDEYPVSAYDLSKRPDYIRSNNDKHR